MLLELVIRDFVIVKALAFPLQSGFNVLTGETGAGKSILIDALGLALGERANADVVRAGAERADITAVFKPSEAVRAWLDAHDIACDDELLLRRVIDGQGKSRAYINGTLSTVAQLRDIGDLLVDVHGQHMHQSLLKAEIQRGILDTQAGLSSSVKAVAEAWQTWQGVRERLSQATDGAQKLREHLAQLAWQMETLDALDPRPGEWSLVSQEHARLSHGQVLIQDTAQALAALDDDETGGQRTIDTALELIQGLQKHDPRLADVAESLASASAAIAQARSDLARYTSSMDLDPQRLAQAEQRMQALFDAGRKFRCDPDALPGLHERTRAELATLSQAQDLDKLQAQERVAAQDYQQAAASLSKARVRAAKQLSQAVSQRMASLGMPGGQFLIAVEPGPAAAHGADKITFLVAGHEGVEPGPLARVASGGELSRVCLALSVVASEAARVPTLIFDEVDSGVSGAVAERVGQLLRELGSRHQVLCVTHLPQVAACGNHHHQVSKGKDDEGHVISRVETLAPAERVDAIARLLGGVKITQTTRDHAQELLSRSG